MKRRMWFGFLAIALAAAMIGGATMAWFTSQDTAGAATFTAGTLKVDVSDGLTTFNSLLPESKHGNMNPGDVYDEIEIVIENTGTKRLAWFGNWSATQVNGQLSDALLDGIYIHSMKMEFKSPGTNPDWETMDHFINNGVGAGSYPGWFNTLAAQGPFPVLSLRQWLNNNGMGTTPYEHMGALKPGYSYKLTVQFGFYAGAGNAYQGDVASPVQIGFAVNATQITAGALEVLQPTFSNHETWLLNQIALQP